MAKRERTKRADEREETKIKFTKTAIERLRAPHPSGQQKLYWDSELTGFGLLVSGISNSRSYVVQRKLPGGKTRRVTVAAVNVLELDDARDKAKEILSQFYQGVDPKAARRAGGNLTLQKALDQYIEARASLREKSKADYRSAIERHLQAWLGLPLRDITPEMIEARHREIQKGIDLGKRQNAKRSVAINGNATANGVMRTLSAIWNFAAERVPELPNNPVRRLRRAWFPVARRERLVTADELPAFFKAVDAMGSVDGLNLKDQDDAAKDRSVKNRTASDYLKLLLFTGLRRREAAQLKWSDIDFAGRMIRIPAIRTKAGRKLDLPMSDLVHGLMVARQALGRDKSGYIFPAQGQSGFLQEPKFPLGQVREATGIRISPHDLRRTFITVAEGADIAPLALKALVNHAVGGDVTSGYVQMTVERLRQPAQKVADRIKLLCGIKEPDGAQRLTGKA